MKKLLKTSLCCLSLLAGVALPSMAVPAKPGIMTKTQADGTSINVRLIGDEFAHMYLTEDGYPLVLENNTYYYATIASDGAVASSSIKATAPVDRSGAAVNFLGTVDKSLVDKALQCKREAAAKRQFKPAVPAFARKNAPAKGPGLFDDATYPVFGEQKGLVILVEYQDVKFQTSYDPHDYFSRMLNQEGFSSYGGTGSARDFFRLNSDDQFIPEFDLYGPVTLPNNMSYYGGNDAWGNDQNPEMMVVHACQALDDQIDFRQYDRNNDGYVDNVFIFYAGRGEASGGAANTVWPHSWDLRYGAGSITLDGVIIDHYACSNEWESGRPDGVGTFVHEFSHVMGLPDLYATRYTSSFTPGSWSAMDYGPYNNNGCTPPLYSAFERYALGWMEPAKIAGPMNATLPTILSNRAGIIETGDPNEFFLVENRQQQGWDAYIPGHGMLVWHVDYDSYVWSRNEVNNTPSHQYVDIEEADGTQSEYTRDGDAFPGTSHVTSFTSSTKPAMKTWANRAIDVPLTDIAENNGVITFKACGGREDVETVEVLDVEEVSYNSFVARWKSLGDDMTYSISVYTRPDVSDQDASDDAAVEYVPGYNNKFVGNATSCLVEGLQEETTYYYVVYAVNGLQTSPASAEGSAFTGRMTIEHRRVVALEPTEITENSFTANWEPLADAAGYVIDLNVKVEGDPVEMHFGFDDGVKNLPEGWSANTKASYSMAPWCGESIPSLRLGKNGDRLEIAGYDDFIYYVGFWGRGNQTAPEDAFIIYCDNGDGWKEFTRLPLEKNVGGKTYMVENIPYGTVAVRISFYRSGSVGSVALDDIVVGHGAELTPEPVPGMTGLDLGNVTSHTFTNLAPRTRYFYTVKAYNDEGVSKPSVEKEARTVNPAGIADLESVGVTFTLAGCNIYLDGVPAGETALLTDIAGRTIDRGREILSAPAPGVYILSVAGVNRKVIVKY